MVVIAMSIFGGPLLHGSSLALIIGILVGIDCLYLSLYQPRLQPLLLPPKLPYPVLPCKLLISFKEGAWHFDLCNRPTIPPISDALFSCLPRLNLRN